MNLLLGVGNILVVARQDTALTPLHMSNAAPDPYAMGMRLLAGVVTVNLPVKAVAVVF